MLFAAKLQAGQPTTLTAKTSGTLTITNVALAPPSRKASLFLQMPDEVEMVVVALSQQALSSFHTEIEFGLGVKQKQTFVARNGSVCLLGRFVPDDSQFKDRPIDEVLKVKRGENVEEGKASKLSNELAARFNKQQDKSDEKQEENKQVDIAPRRSTRTRTPAPPPKPQSKSKRPAKMASSSKGKGGSLLQMMQNLDEDDDEDSSEYSQEQQSSSSSSSSSEDEESDQTPKKSSKKEPKQQKIERKGSNNQSSIKFTKMAGTFEEIISAQCKRVITEKVKQDKQKGSKTKWQGQQDFEPLHGSLQFNMQSGLTLLSFKILKKVMQQLPPPPQQSESGNSDNNSSPITQQEANWLKKYQKCLAQMEQNIEAFDIRPQERSIAQSWPAQRKEKSKDDRSKSVLQQREGSMRRQSSKRVEVQQQYSGQKKETKQGESSFAYPVPTVLPDFVLRK